MNWETWKVVIFYGAVLLWIAWGVMDFSAIYPFQILLVVMIFGLAILIEFVWQKKNVAPNNQAYKGDFS
jgi:hypothetical protein